MNKTDKEAALDTLKKLKEKGSLKIEINDLAISWKYGMLEEYLLHSTEHFEGNDLHDFLNAVVRTANKLNALKLEQTNNQNNEKS